MKPVSIIGVWLVLVSAMAMAVLVTANVEESGVHFALELANLNYAQCIEWQGTYDYASSNSAGQLVSASSSPCDPSACCCWQSYVRVDCGSVGDNSAQVSIDIDDIKGQCSYGSSNIYYNHEIYFTSSSISSSTFTLNLTKYSLNGTFSGANAVNVNNLDYLSSTNNPPDIWNLYFYMVSGNPVLSAINQGSASCSAMFNLINRDSYYQFPGTVSFNFPLVAFLVGLGEVTILTITTFAFIYLSRHYPQWRLFISDEETRRNKRAERAKKKAALVKAKKEAREKIEQEKAEKKAAAQKSRRGSHSQAVRSKMWWTKSKKEKKPKDAKEAASQSESSAFYHEVAQADSAAVLEKMESWLGGLSDEEVQNRLIKYGKNIPAKEDRYAVFKYFFKSLVNPFNFLLVSLAILTYTFPPPGDPIGGSIIMFMVVLSVVITFVQDYRSNNAIAKLKSMVKATTVVYRRVSPEDKVAGGESGAEQEHKAVVPVGLKQEREAMTELVERANAKDLKSAAHSMDSNLVSKRVDVDVTEIVPGDILFLTAGSVIPADVRIISCKDLFVAQSALTGESFPVEKSAHASLDHKDEKPAVAAPLMKTKKHHKAKKAPKLAKTESNNAQAANSEEKVEVQADVKSEVASSSEEQKHPLIDDGSDATSGIGSGAASSSGTAVSDSSATEKVSGKNELAEPKAANPLDALSDERFFDTTTGQAFGGNANAVVPRSGRLDEDEDDDNERVELSRSAVHWYMEGVEGDDDKDLPSTERIDTSQIHLHLDSRLRTMERDDAARQHIEPIVTGLKDAVAAAMSEHSRLRFERKEDEEDGMDTYESEEEEDDDDDDDQESSDEEKRQSDNRADQDKDNEKDKPKAEVAVEIPAAGAAAPSTEKPAAAAKSESIFEHANLAFMGSSVTSGVATAVVVRTGTQTVLGELATMLTAMKPPTSFEKGIASYVGLMFKFMLGMGVFVTIVNGLTGKSWYNAFGFAIVVAIGLTPEMLPVVITVNLAKGAMDLLARKVIVKRLISVQNLGAIEVLCTDKTGTLTDDRIQLHQYLDVDGNVQPSVLVKAAVNSSFQTAFRNMLDENVIQKAQDHQAAAMEGIKKLTKIDEIPFDFNRKRMSVIVQEEEGQHILVCKGAAEEMIKLSTSMAKFPKDGKDLTLSPANILSDDNITLEKVDTEKRNQLISTVHKMNGQGFRVVCVAMRRLKASAEHTYGVSDEKDMILFGFLVFLDPPKEGVDKSIESLHNRGVQIKVCTGDNEKVTHYVCQKIGIPVNRILLGSEIGRMNDESLQKAVHECDIFAKLSPLDKERVVKAIKATGRSVGFLGDGVNDAAALKAADVGISVDNAVEIAKESADVILLTKSLDVLDRGVLLGRISFANIIKYIKMAASSNFGNMFSVLGLSVMLPVTPLQPVQILVNNLLYDFSQIALPFDSVDPEWVAKPRQWDMKDLSTFIMLIGPTSSVFDYWTWAMSWYILGYHGDTKRAFESAQTVWWMESLFSQTLIVHLIRTTKIPFIQSRASVWLIGTTLTIMAIACILPYIPGTIAIPLRTVDTQVFGWLILIMVIYWCFTSYIKSLYYKIWPNSSC